MMDAEEFKARLYEVASDGEAAMLDELQERAGLTWTCPVRAWTNPKGERCGDCGRTEAEARAHWR